MSGGDFGISRSCVFGTSQVVLTTEPLGLGPAVLAVSDVTRAVDAACSRFRGDSELMRAHGAAAPVAISALLVGLLSAALEAARDSDGAVDCTVGAALRATGYDRDFAGISEAPWSAESGPAPGWRRIRLDRRRRTLEIPAGVWVDLGSTAKAQAADMAAGAAAEAAGCGVLVSLGGDIATAGPPPAGGWRIGIADDSATDPRDADETVSIDAGGLATSSTIVRAWTQAGERRHHIIDPRTGRPAQSPWRTVSVAAPTCLAANVAATAAIVMGATAPAWLAEHHRPARLVGHHGAVIATAGWPVSSLRQDRPSTMSA